MHAVLYLLVYIFPMARLANIVHSSRNSFDPRCNLTCRDVVANEHGLIVTFHSLKTIQFGECKCHIPLLCLPSSPLCPVSTFQRMFPLVPTSPQSALFLLSGPRGCTLLTKHRFVGEFRCPLSAAGVSNAFYFQGHSFCWGAAS